MYIFHLLCKETLEINASYGIAKCYLEREHGNRCTVAIRITLRHARSCKRRFQENWYCFSEFMELNSILCQLIWATIALGIKHSLVEDVWLSKYKRSSIYYNGHLDVIRAIS